MDNKSLIRCFGVEHHSIFLYTVCIDRPKISQSHKMYYIFYMSSKHTLLLLFYTSHIPCIRYRKHVLVVAFPQRCHASPQRFSLRILDLSSCDLIVITSLSQNLKLLILWLISMFRISFWTLLST